MFHSVQQIQAYPTAMLWVGGSRAPRDVIEAGKDSLALVGFTNPAEFDRNVTDQGADSLKLSAFSNPAREQRSITENTPTARIGLSGFVPAIPLNRPITETQPSDRIALAGFGNPSRDSRTPTSDQVGAPRDALKLAGFNGNLETETSTWLAAVIANSGSASTSTVLALNQWVKAIKAAGIRSKILRFNLLCGDAFGNSSSSHNLGAVQVPIIKDKGGSVDASNQAQNQWTYTERGSGGGLKYSGGGSHGILQSGFVCALDFASDSDAGFCCYVTVNASAESTWAMGAQDGSGNDMGLIGPDFTAVGTRGDIWKTGTAISDAGGKGFYHVTKDSGAVKTYKNASLLTNQSNPGGNRVNSFEVYFGGLNLANSVSSASNRTFAAFGLLLAMSAAEDTALYNATQAFQTALGRQV